MVKYKQTKLITPKPLAGRIHNIGITPFKGLGANKHITLKIIFIPLFLTLLLFISCSPERNETKTRTVDLSNDIVKPKHYIVTKTADQIIIDGKADEKAWQQASFTDSFIDIEGVKPAKYESKVKMLWDDQYLYIYAYMEEPHIWADINEPDAVIYYNNDFEIFIDPSESGINYGEIEINALGTVWDLMLNRPYRSGGKAISSWNIKDLKSAVYIEGSLNDPSDTDSFWSVETAIPIKALQELKGRPRQLPNELDQWRINFSRVEWEHEIIDGKYQRKKVNGKYLPEYNWVWNAQNVIDMHQPDKWGFLHFTIGNDPKQFIYADDTDIEVKLLAHSLIRETQKKQLKDLKENEDMSTQKLQVKYSEKDTLDVLFVKTYYGYEYIIKSPFLKCTYVINQSGILKTIQ